MSVQKQVGLDEMDRIYEQYGRPLEAEHWGEYVAIAPDGRTILADDRLDAAERALARFGPGVYLFKVGERIVGKMR